MRSLNSIRYSKICHYNQYGFAAFTLSINKKKMNSGQFYTFDQLKNNFFGFLKKELCCIEVSIESFFIAKPISKTILQASHH